MIVLKDEYNTMKVKCPHCMSLLQLNANDIQGGDVSAYFCKCGACQKTIPLASHQIPQPVLDQLKD